jgi:molybdate transport repressor ModE-like protein/molybdopterin-binding protein
VTERPRTVTDTDVALLRMLARERSVVAASRSVGISRDRATYRLARLEQAFGGPVVESIRGGRGHGETQLTPLGDRIVRQGFDSLEMLNARPLTPPSRSNVLHGTYHREPVPEVSMSKGLRLRVAFPAEEGERVSLLIDPEAILVARRRFASSARNVLPARIEEVRPGAGPQGWTLVAQAGPVRLRVAVTEEPVHQLALAPGARVWLYVKATAVRRVGRAPGASTRGSPHR